MTKLERIWTAALGELRLQMTKATFDTWVRDTRALELDGDCLVIGVSNEYSREWLENRLTTTMERTLTGILGYPVRVRFLVTELRSAMSSDVPNEALGPDVIAVKFYQFDPKGQGWLQTSKYDVWFWQPLVGCVAWGVYQFFRCEEKQNSGWGGWFTVSGARVAATLDVNRQKITGVEREGGPGGKYWQPGAFDRLEGAGIAKTERLGSGRNISYRVSCLHNLPLLTPAQVEILPAILQESHAEFLRRASIEYQEWTQLELPTLVQLE